MFLVRSKMCCYFGQISCLLDTMLTIECIFLDFLWKFKKILLKSQPNKNMYFEFYANEESVGKCPSNHRIE